MLGNLLYYAATKMLRSLLHIRLSPRQQYSHDYLLSPRWLALRWLTKTRDGWACRHCGRRWRLEVHHLRYQHRGALGLWGFIMELSDLETLCDNCHSGQHRKGEA